ncbi:MAG: hypothetical protein GF404_10435 [candidate division Zixibacteria bacterium]|nr:hypothetical protein [candidate division Zixibacteria bacterium]
MGKLLMLILVIALVLVILPSDLRDWCMFQLGKMVCVASDAGYQSADTTAHPADSEHTFDMEISSLLVSAV